MTSLSQRDSRWGNLKLGTGNTLIKDYGLEMNPLKMIFFRVFAPTQQFEVFNSIIMAISIYMVDCFICFKFSSNVFFHDKSMFITSSTINRNKSVPILSNSAINRPSEMFFPHWMIYFVLNFWRSENSYAVTFSRAIFSTFYSRFSNVKFFTTVFTNNIFPIFNHSNTHYSTKDEICNY